MSLKTREIIGEISKERVWINNGTVNQFIKSSKVEQYLFNGWKIGRMPLKTHNRNKNRWINNTLENKHVHINDLESYFKKGWVRGRIKSNLHWITNGIENRMVNDEKLKLENGWRRGKTQREVQYA